MRLQNVEGTIYPWPAVKIKMNPVKRLKVAPLNIPKMDEIFIMKIIASNISIGTELAIKIIAHKR